MANSFALAQKYLPLLDAVYKNASLTSDLDVNPAMIRYAGANTVKIFKTRVPGLGNYGRNNGFVEGDATGTWEILTLSKDRGRTFSVDRMDNDETLDMAFVTLSGEFIRTRVVPEIDAYRFSVYASVSGILSTAAALSEAANVLSAIDAATAAMDEAEISSEGRILYMTPTIYTMLKQSAAVTRFASMSDMSVNRNFETFDGMRVKKVPQSRFYSGITMYDGTTAGQTDGGYVKGTGASDINFMIIHPTSVIQPVKHTLPRIFDPDTNQKMDAWKFDYRIYHDAFVLENKSKGIYLHKKPTV